MKRGFLFLILWAIAWGCFAQTPFVALVENHQNPNPVIHPYDDILAEATLNGWTAPSASVQQLQRDYIDSLMVNNIWQEEDIMYVPAQDGSKDFGRINWKDPDGAFTLSETGTVDWFWNGYRNRNGSGGGDGMLTGWHPGTDGVNFTLTDASASIYIDATDTYTNDAISYFGGSQWTGSGSRMEFLTQGTTQHNIRSNSTNTALVQHSAIPDRDKPRLWSVVRDEAQVNDSFLFEKGKSVISADIASVGFNQTAYHWYIGAANYDQFVADGSTESKWAIFTAGSGQYADQQKKSDLADWYMAELREIVNPLVPMDENSVYTSIGENATEDSYIVTNADLPTLDNTFSFLVRAVAYEDYGNFTSFIGTSNSTVELFLGFDQQDDIRFQAYEADGTASGTDCETSSWKNDGLMHTWIVTVDDGTCYIYIDGTQVCTNTEAGFSGWQNEVLRIMSSSTSRQMPGEIQAVQMYDRVLTASEITSLSSDINSVAFGKIIDFNHQKSAGIWVDEVMGYVAEPVGRVYLGLLDYSFETARHVVSWDGFVADGIEPIHISWGGNGQIIVGDDTGYDQHEYSMTDLNDITTLTKETPTFAWGLTTQAAIWDVDDTNILTISNSTSMRTRSASTPGDISTVGSNTVGSILFTETRGLSYDYGDAYIMDQGNDRVYKVDDIDFGTFTQTISDTGPVLTDTGLNVQGLANSPNGRTMLVLDVGQDRFYTYDNGTLFTPSTMTFNNWDYEPGSCCGSVQYNTIRYMPGAQDVVGVANNANDINQFKLYNGVQRDNQIYNGDFSLSNAGAEWDLQNGSTISNGELVINTASQYVYPARQTMDWLRDEQWYMVTYDITEYTSGSIRVSWNTSASPDNGEQEDLVSAVGTYKTAMYLNQGVTPRLIFSNGSAGSVMKIDNVFVEPIGYLGNEMVNDPNLMSGLTEWETAISDFTFENGIATHGNTGTDYIRNSTGYTFTQGKFYRIEVDVESNSGTGVNQIYIGNSSTLTVNDTDHLDAGKHVYYFEFTPTTRTSQVVVYGRVGAPIAIKSISCREVIAEETQVVENGDFRSATGWNLSPNDASGEATIANGILTLISNDGTYKAASQTGIIDANSTYRYRIKVPTFNSGTLNVNVGDGADSINITSAGTYTGTFTVGASPLDNNLYLKRSGTVDCEVEYIYLWKEN